MTAPLSSNALLCASDISHIVVHAHGAVVTRRVTLPEGAAVGDIDCVVTDVTLEADPGSVRVSLGAGQATLVGVRSAVHIPETSGERGPTVERLEVLRAQHRDLDDRLDYLRKRERAWTKIVVAPRGRKTIEAMGPLEGARAALMLSDLVGAHRRAVALEVQQVREQLEEIKRTLEAVEFADGQRSQQERMGTGHPTRRFVVQLAKVEGLEFFELSYIVSSARWWPAYTLYLEDQGREGRLVSEAVIAQACGEDWNGVSLSLSTAQLVQDARLPELASKRLGRAQPSKSRGYREPPGGLDKLFASYDMGLRQAGAPLPMSRGGQDTDSYPVMAPPFSSSLMESAMNTTYGSAPPSAPPPAPASAPRSSGGPPPSGAPQYGAALGGSMDRGGYESLEGEEMAKEMRARSQAPMKKSKKLIAPRQEETSEAIEPGEDWLDFDGLVMAGPDAPYRGRLKRRESGHGSYDDESIYEATSRALGLGLVDPMQSKGSFDYRFEAQGKVRIPSDGGLHRVRVSEGRGPSEITWRSAPRVEAAVYREVSLKNPTGHPLLAGPIRIFIDGELRTQSALETLDVAGAIKLGLGVDENLRVVRNVRVREDGAGLLGGKRTVLHEVDIELRSSLGYPARVDVIERIPVTDEDTVDVELVSDEPRSSAYDQKERGRALRGGRQWSVTLPAAGALDIHFAYRITLRSKDEIIGGNRRE